LRPRRRLYSFNNNGKDGHNPYAALIFDTSGNLYGTTLLGGTHDFGTVFELTPKAAGGWTEKILHEFNGPDGYYPQGGVSRKKGGGWTEKILNNFVDTDGWDCQAGLIFDTAGNLYGTTRYGGVSGDVGTVFELPA